MIFGDIARALGQMGDLRFLAVLAKAVGLTLAVLMALMGGIVWAAAWFLPDTLSLGWLGSVSLDAPWISFAMLGVAMFGSIFLMIPMASLMVGFFVEDVANAVEARHYAHLPLAKGQDWAEIIGDTIRFLALMLFVNLLALIVYIAANVFAPFVFLAVNGLLLGREYFYLVAARRLGVKGARALFRQNFMTVWITGILMALPLTVPILNLLIPVIGVASFTHQFHRLAE